MEHKKCRKCGSLFFQEFFDSWLCRSCGFFEDKPRPDLFHDRHGRKEEMTMAQMPVSVKMAKNGGSIE